MKQFAAAKITSKARVIKIVKKIKKIDLRNSSFIFYKDLFDGITKNKTKRQFSYFFLMKMLELNMKESEIKLIINYHVSYFPGLSKFDYILYKTTSEIIDLYKKRKQLTLQKINIRNIKKIQVTSSCKSNGNSNIYKSNQIISMKPLRG